MSLYDAFKNVVSLAQKAGNVDPMRKVVDLQNDAFALAEENRVLKERLALQSALAFRDNAYWKPETNDGPYCSKCWDVDAKLVRVHQPWKYKPQPRVRHRGGRAEARADGVAARPSGFHNNDCTSSPAGPPGVDTHLTLRTGLTAC